MSSFFSSHSLLRERDLDELVLELDHAHANPVGRLLDPAPPELLVDLRVDPDVLRLRLHVAYDVLADRLDCARGALRPRDGLHDAQGNRQDALLFFRHRFTSSACSCATSASSAGA